MNKYKYILKPQHPFADKDGYVPKHRLMYENYLSILMDEEVFIPKGYVIHHINKIRNDNSLINLELLSNSEHTTIHMIGNKHGKKDLNNRICLLCSSYKTETSKKGWAHWFKFNNGFICRNCYKRKNRLVSKRADEYKVGFEST